MAGQIKLIFVGVACIFACMTLAIAQQTGDKAATRNIAVLDYSAPVPQSWVEQKPETSMRLAQFSVPGEQGLEAAEALVFYFGRGAGTADGNIARWESQFATPDGKPIKAQVRRLIVNGMRASTAELTGSYARGIGMGPIGAYIPDQSLLAAVIETARGNIIIQLHGVSAVVGANRAAFENMVQGFKYIGPAQGNTQRTL